MAGYSGYSKSNNALDAEADGLFPASKLKLKGVTAVKVREFFEPWEWHHTSKNYNRTNYYCRFCVAWGFGIKLDDDATEVEWARFDDPNIEDFPVTICEHCEYDRDEEFGWIKG